MFRAALIALPLLVAPVALPAPVAAASAAEMQSRTGENCEQQNERSRRRGRGIGGMFGSIVGGRIGGLGGVVGSVLPVGELLGEAIASLLDCREQRQAATATEEAVRGGVGTTASWESETRQNVTGSSTVTGAEPLAGNGDQCLTVTDVVIIDGQETRAPKRMCRRPPNNRYVRV
jgi:surface antigen